MEYKVLVCINNYNKDDNAIQLYKLFSKSFDTKIVDTYHLDNGGDILDKECNVIYLHNVFCGGLFNKDYELFKDGDYNYLLIVESDVLIKDDKIIDRIKLIVSDPDSTVYAYAPSLVAGSSSYGCKAMLTKNCFGYNLSTGRFRDCHEIEGWFALYHKEVVEAVFSEVSFDNNKYGWFVHNACCRYAIKRGKRCVIDDNVSVFHPSGCGYPQSSAFDIGRKFKKYIFDKLNLYYIDETPE